jgi:hypothetical protein
MTVSFVWARALVVLGAAALVVSSAPVPSDDQPAGRRYALPMSLVEEHAEIYGAVRQASSFAGELGVAARALSALIEPHVEKEQRYALAMLKVLPPLSRGEITADMEEWLLAANLLRAELETLKREHRAIAVAADQFSRAAWAERRPEYALTAQRVVRHMRMEEEVLYPAAIVAGDYLRLKFGPARSTETALAGSRGTQ